MEEKKLFKVVITAIVVKDGRYLILKRSESEKKFPSRWTVPGGKLSTEDYIHLPKDTPDYWYNVLERTLRRETKEEAGIEIKNIRYAKRSPLILLKGFSRRLKWQTQRFSGMRLASGGKNDKQKPRLEGTVSLDLLVMVGCRTGASLTLPI